MAQPWSSGASTTALRSLVLLTAMGLSLPYSAAGFQSADINAQANRALADQKAGHLDKAIAAYAALDAAARAQHRTLPASVLANYARALAANGQLDPALVEMKAASAVDPRDAKLQDDLGSLYARQQQWAEAQSHFAAAASIAPTLAVAHLHLGLALQAQGDPAALHELARAAQLAPQNNSVAFEYSKALAAAGEDAKAVEVLHGILARDHVPADPLLIDASYALALALQRTGGMTESIVLLRKVLAAQPENAGAMINLGMALSQTQHAVDAVPLLRRAVALAPNDVVAHQDLAAALMQLNQFADAIVELREALQLAPDLPQIHYDLGFAYKMQDDAANATPELETAERLDSHQAEAPYLLGVLYMQAGRYGDAARELKTSLNLRPQNGDGWATLGSVYNKLDRLPEATAALEEAIRQLPHQPDPRLTLAAVLVKQNKNVEAIEQRKQAAVLMKQNMNRQRAEVATHSGESLRKSGDLAGAAAQFNEALSYDASYAEAHLGLATIYEAEGKKSEAAVERKKAANSESPSSSQ
jgi:tetratricopeptide (TPR) repeat protein